VATGDPNAPGFQVGGLTGTALEPGRRNLLAALDAHGPDDGGFAGLRQRAVEMLTSPATEAAFDLAREPARVRDRYGRNIHGQSVLLARRLVEAGVRLVQVNWHNDGQNFWDTHGNNFRQLKDRLMPPADQAFSALLEDLDQRGLLGDTLVLWAGEFGRTPKISAGNAGREHWPGCYSAVLAGGGVRGGGRVWVERPDRGAAGHEPGVADRPNGDSVPGAGCRPGLVGNGPARPPAPADRRRGH